MATVTNAVTTASTANVTTYASGAFTPTAGDLLLVFATVSGTAAAGSMTASANGITFTKVTDAALGGGAHMLYCFVANQLVGASPVSMAVTMDVTGDAGTGCVIGVTKIAGMTNTGASAILQSARQQNISTGTPAPVFASSCLTANATLGAVAEESGPTSNSAVPPASTTELGDLGYATPAQSLEYWSRDSGFTGTTPTWTSVASAIFGSIAVEMDTSGAAVTARSDIMVVRRTWARA